MAFDPSILSKLSPKTRYTPEVEPDAVSDEEMDSPPQIQPWSLEEDTQGHLWGNMDFSKGDSKHYLDKLRSTPARAHPSDMIEKLRSTGQHMMNWTHLFRSKSAFLKMFIPDVIEMHLLSVQSIGNSWRVINEESKTMLNKLAGISAGLSSLSDDSEYTVINISLLKMKIGELIANNESALQFHISELKGVSTKFKSWVSSPDVFLERLEAANANFAAANSRLMQFSKSDPIAKTFAHLGSANGNLWLNQFIFHASVNNYSRFIHQKFISALVPYITFVQKVQTKLRKCLAKTRDYVENLIQDPIEKQQQLEKIDRLIKETEDLGRLDFRNQLHLKYQKIVSRVLSNTQSPLIEFFQKYSISLLADNSLCGYYTTCNAAVKNSNRPCYVFIDVRLL